MFMERVRMIQFKGTGMVSHYEHSLGGPASSLDKSEGTEVVSHCSGTSLEGPVSHSFLWIKLNGIGVSQCSI